MSEVRTADVKKPATAPKAAKMDAFAGAEEFTKQARDQFETAYSTFNENTAAMREQTEEMMATCRANYETAQERFKTVSADMMSAAREETADAVEFVNELARAKSVADALEIQRTYWTNLFETRVQRTRDLTQMSVDAARESFEPFAKSMSGFSAMAPFEKMFPFAAK